MPVEQEVGTVREAVGVFSRPEDLQDAIDELLSSGFDRADLSLLASEHAVKEKLGHRYEKISALADDPTVPRAAYVSTEAIGGAEGGLIGGLMYVGATVAARPTSPGRFLGVVQPGWDKVEEGHRVAFLLPVGCVGGIKRAERAVPGQDVAREVETTRRRGEL